MRFTLPIIAMALALQGCIVYDHDCPGCEVPDQDDDYRPDRPGDDDPEPGDTGGDDQPNAPDYGFYLTPDEAEAGDTFIASLRADGEDPVELEDIADLNLYGDVQILASDLRSSELLLTVQVDAQADLGLVDLLVELEDGSASFTEGVLEIFAAGSGHSGGTSDDGSGDDCE